MSKNSTIAHRTDCAGLLCYNHHLNRRPSTRKLRHIPDPLQVVQGGLDGDNLVFWDALRQRALADSLPVYLVGGPVRDVLLGAPIKDLDFVLEGDAVALARQMAADLGWGLTVYQRFGTATVSRDGCNIDLVTARKETYPSTGALPEISPSTIVDDLARRDFSLNCLALPMFQETPQILDQHDGLADLEQGLVRALHPRSFIDDPTRILRAVRYEQRFGFKLEPETEKQLSSALAQCVMESVSGDRLRHELERILEEEAPAPSLVRAIGLGVLPAIQPALTDASAVATLNSKLSVAIQSKGLHFLAALAYRLSPADAESLIRRLNLPRNWAEVVRDTVALRGLEAQLSQERLSPSQTTKLLEGMAESAVVAVLYISDNPAASRRMAQYQSELRWVTSVLDGDALLAMGVPEGPVVGEILTRLRDSRLDGLVKSEQEERQLVEEVLGGGVND